MYYICEPIFNIIIERGFCVFVTNEGFKSEYGVGSFPFKQTYKDLAFMFMNRTDLLTNFIRYKTVTYECHTNKLRPS
jgi:hypothetical protein